MAKLKEDIKRKLIFIAGFPLSGATRVANLIIAHPSVIYRHEVIGRCFNPFHENIFNALRFNNGLNKG